MIDPAMSVLKIEEICVIMGVDKSSTTNKG